MRRGPHYLLARQGPARRQRARLAGETPHRAAAAIYIGSAPPSSGTTTSGGLSQAWAQASRSLDEQSSHPPPEGSRLSLMCRRAESQWWRSQKTGRSSRRRWGLTS